MTRASLGSLLVAALASSALAQPAPAPPAPPSADDPGEQAYQRGRKHYDLREWDQAIAEFKEAYRIRNDAASLFNIAQSYRLKGDCAEAASFYKTYRRNYPDAPNTARVDQFIVEMEDCAKRAPQTTTAPPSTDAPTSTVTTTAPPLPPGPTRERSNAAVGHMGIGIAGAGVLCVAGGILFALHAQSIEDDVMDLPRWDPDLHDKGERADLSAKLLLGVGGAALISGGVMMYLGYRTVERPSSGSALRVVPSTDGATVTWAGRF